MKSYSFFFIFLAFSFNTFAQISEDGKQYTVNTDRLKFPISNKGEIGVNFFQDDLVLYDNVSFILSAGFMLSGYSNDTLWVNGQMSSIRFYDYLSGPVNSVPNDPKSILYIVKKDDPPFGDSWQKWKDAVDLGADFCDGDNDGIYNPVDKNNNGKWDEDEDMPELIADETIWCVYNDGVPASERQFWVVNPQGIEIHQTVFVNNSTEQLKDVIFIRYRIINKGTVTAQMDSVYFSVFADPDIGYYTDDLAGCDTLLNSGFCYNSGYDTFFGDNSPASTISFLQGPIIYLPGTTFIDTNENGIYDEGIDTPITNAYYFKSKQGFDIIEGAKNLEISSYTVIIHNHPVAWLDMIDCRAYSQGKPSYNSVINPCDFFAGQVIGGIDCSEVNPFFHYSGDVIWLKGWIQNLPTDIIFYSNIGPFKLIKDEPVDIIIAYISARSDNHPLASLNLCTIKTRNVIFRFNNNLIQQIDEDEPENPVHIVNEYKLEQNYPNPFNSGTTIKYQIPKAGIVTIKVYDILGREVAKLVNEEKPAGSYEVEFDGSKLTSGVYFYTMTAGKFSATKKLILLK